MMGAVYFPAACGKLALFRRKAENSALEPTEAIDDAVFAVIEMPTLRDGAISFDLPTMREAFDLFVAGVSHGFVAGHAACGRERDNETRQFLGVQILRRWPGSKPHGR